MFDNTISDYFTVFLSYFTIFFYIFLYLNVYLPYFTYIDLILPSFTEFYRVLPSFTEFYRILPSFTEFFGNTGLYILPFVAVAKEKARWLKMVTQDVGLRVESFAGASTPASGRGLSDVDLAVCTIEKANSLVNRLIEEATLHQVASTCCPLFRRPRW